MSSTAREHMDAHDDVLIGGDHCGQPAVSIGLPVFNGERYLERALRCVLAQDFPDFELIISDNASTDRTEDICRAYAARDTRIKYHRNRRNIGASGNYNRVFQLARAPLFKWASHDDEFDPSFIRRCVEEFRRAPSSVVLVFSWAVIIDDEGRTLERSPDSVSTHANRPSRRLGSLFFNSQYAHLLWGVIRSSALRQTRLMGHFEADHVLLAELALRGGFAEIPEVLYQQRRHAGSAMSLHRSARELLAWHDPTKGGKPIVLPRQLQLFSEYAGSIRRSQIRGYERLLCYAAVPGVPVWRWILRRTGPIRRRLGLFNHRKPRPIAG